MRVMVLIKANKDSEAGVLPSERLLTEMGKFNEELVNAGLMLAGEGLHPSSRGKRVSFAGGKTTVTEGPFETKEIVAGFWLWRVKSIEEAVAWVKRVPNPDHSDGEIEIRPVFEADDLRDTLNPELREQEDRLRAQIDQPSGKQKISLTAKIQTSTPHCSPTRASTRSPRFQPRRQADQLAQSRSLSSRLPVNNSKLSAPAPSIPSTTPYRSS